MKKIKKNTKKIISLILAAVMALSAGVLASAATIEESGASGSTPVKLTTTNDGLGENGDGTGTTPAATKMSVTVPTSFPMAMNEDGDVITATGMKITNNSFGAVRVRSVTIKAASGWNLTPFGDKATLAGEKVDSNKLGFAMRIGGGDQIKTSSSSAVQTLLSSPAEGGYMSGAGDQSANTAAVEYSAIVTPLSEAVTEGTTVADVVFVIEWDT